MAQRRVTAIRCGYALWNGIVLAGAMTYLTVTVVILLDNYDETQAKIPFGWAVALGAILTILYMALVDAFCDNVLRRACCNTLTLVRRWRRYRGQERAKAANQPEATLPAAVDSRESYEQQRERMIQTAVWRVERDHYLTQFQRQWFVKMDSFSIPVMILYALTGVILVMANAASGPLGATLEKAATLLALVFVLAAIIAPFLIIVEVVVWAVVTGMLCWYLPRLRRAAD